MSLVSVTTVHDDQIEAARVLSLRLDAEGLKYVFIGGFACAVLGSERLTKDTDVLIEIRSQDIVALRKRLADLDARFVVFGIKFYFVRELPPPSSQTASTSVENSQRNVLIETLAAGTLGLPAAAGPVYIDPQTELKLLHPSVLPLTKLKRWSTMRSSTRPQTRAKVLTDQEDILNLIRVLVERKMKLSFGDYAGKTRGQLLPLVATFHDSFRGDVGFCASLKEAMYAEDWEEMLRTSPLVAD
ncbi:hypothetical protein L227DRAFT_554503 [Lentinus tigrinus ALCF2SS1-6]|uniref:Nucleotidyltransferase n=1 Tax=Lentinus tigrinus ALCF2SS1-6 TaxID=1328759 RepID=A0A5C2RVK1_9APHY|nr:hypothetical protein L227DRAFT_554503 [Lentinus tigrinus ALCF2SS1-6]